MTSLEFKQTADHIHDICQRLHRRNMLAAADGNISVRLKDDLIMITPSGVSKAFMQPQDMVLMNLKGEAIQGVPSSEKLMHLTVFQKCPQAHCVIHAHPVTATAWSIAQPHLEKLPSEALSEVILATGGIPFVPYARPGTQAMGDVLNLFLPQYRALILRRHGALAWGESIEEAYRGMERIEHSAQVLMAAHQLGGITALPDNEIQYLYEMRKKIGETLL
ncbi:MAG: class II aldolase/adducin family protein [Bdellovibrionales bacterium]